MSLTSKVINIGSKKRFDNFLVEYKNYSYDELNEWRKGLSADIYFGTNTRYDKQILSLAEAEIEERKIRLSI
jgi:hypothetical protein